MTDPAQQGARNLLTNCAGMQPGQRLLILAEDPAGYYAPGLAETIAAAATSLGLTCEIRTVPFTPDPQPPGDTLVRAMQTADRTLFLARMGDQLRFDPSLAGIRPIVCYALDTDMLASPFGRANHQAFTELKTALDTALGTAKTIRVTCPLGTDFSGPGTPAHNQETSVTRFPLSVFTPIQTPGFKGQIALSGFLTGTGSRYYAPYTIPLDGILTVHFDGPRIIGFGGSPADRNRAETHYRTTAARLGIDAQYIHSWHAGIHPGCAFPTQAADDPERWGGSAFGSPRILHFHSCGAYAPGEISLNVADPTIRLDGIAVWENGRLHPDRIARGADILARYPDAAAAFASPEQNVGLDANGRLGSPQNPR